MATSADWASHESDLERFRAALHRVLEVLVVDDRMREQILTRMLAEPASIRHPLLVDRGRIHWDDLMTALDLFWAEYRLLPDLERRGAWFKYLSTPDPLPRLQQRVLEQCYRLREALQGALDPALEKRLEKACYGDVSPVPGMEFEWLGWVRREASRPGPGAGAA